MEPPHIVALLAFRESSKYAISVLYYCSHLLYPQLSFHVGSPLGMV